MPLEVERKDVCLIWGCARPLHDENGKRLGERGMCWKHLKQAQRAGDLVPINGLPVTRCKRCGRKATKYRGLRLCARCHQTYLRRHPVSGAKIRAYDRERKRAVRARNKLAKEGAMTG